MYGVSPDLRHANRKREVFHSTWRSIVSAQGLARLFGVAGLAPLDRRDD